jgi:type II secretory pathway predicted ATPase ExeA
MSYLEHFRLTEQPFRLTPDPDFLYWSKQHARAKAYMESTIWLADGFVIITGDIGSGKTTLLQSFLTELDDDVVYAVVSQTQLTPTEFLQAILTEFGFKPFDKGKVELLDMLNMFLIEQYSNGKKVVLIIDEAQNLTRKVLEEVRMISGIETHKEKVLRIILAGQPELKDKLDSPNLEQLVQRVRLSPWPAAPPQTCSRMTRTTSFSGIQAACRGSSTRCAIRHCCALSLTRKRPLASTTSWRPLTNSTGRNTAR